MKHNTVQPKISFCISTLNKHKNLLLFLFLISLSVLLLFNNLGVSSLDTADEAFYSYYDIYLTIDSTNIFFPDNNLKDLYYYKPPLRSWLMYPIINILGYNTFTLRLLGVIFGLLTITAVYYFCYKKFDSYVGFIACIMLLTSKAMIKGAWIRFNSYDAGYIFGFVLFICIFHLAFMKKHGWILCGFAFAFIFMFKHMAAFVALSIVLISLIINYGLKEIFTKRITGMMLLGIGVPLLWYIPFSIKHPGFIEFMLDKQFFQFVVSGYDFFPGANNPFYYFYALKDSFDGWFPLLIISVVVCIFFLIKQRNKDIMHLYIWALVPFILFSIAHSRLDKYIYPIFIPLSIITALAVVYTFRWIKNSRIENKRIFLFAFLIALILLISVNIYNAYKMTQDTFVQPYDTISKAFSNGKNKLKFFNLKRTNYDWAERCHLFSEKLDNNKSFLGSNEDFESALSKIDLNVGLISIRRELIRWITKKDSEGINRYSDLRFYNFSNYYDYVIGKHPMKILILKKDSTVDLILKKHNYVSHYFADLKYIENSKTVQAADDKIFIEYISDLIFGFSLTANQFNFYDDLLQRHKITRPEIIQRFYCSAISEDIVHYPPWEGHPGTNLLSRFTDDVSHLIVDYKFIRDNADVYIWNFESQNLEGIVKCYFSAAISRFKSLDTYEEVFQKLQNLNSSDVLLLRGDEYLKLISDNRFQNNIPDKFSFIEPIRVRQFWSGFDYLSRRVYAVFNGNGEFNSFLKAYNIQSTHLKPLEKIIQWNINENRKFIKHVSIVLYDKPLPASERTGFRKELDSGKMTRKEMVEILIKQALKK